MNEAFTLFGAAPVQTGPGVWGVFGVSGGGTVTRPVENISFVLREETQGLVLEATLELPWVQQKHTEPAGTCS